MLERLNANVVPFADDASGTNRTVFGGSTQSDNIDDNVNTDFKSGWEVVGVNEAPPKQWFNALGFTLGNLISYLYQQGISEWNTNQEYFVNSYVVGSDGLLYRAKTGTSGTPNVGNNPTVDSTNWESLDSKFVDLQTGQTINGTKTFTSFPITPASEPTQDYRVANKKYVDDRKTEVINVGFGINQTWQNVKASRSIGVSYQNTSGKAIQVFVNGDGTTGAVLSAIVDGITIGRSGTGSIANRSPLSFTVVSGATYRVDLSVGNIEYWSELRS
jgi:hypothetical protein